MQNLVIASASSGRAAWVPLWSWAACRYVSGVQGLHQQGLLELSSAVCEDLRTFVTV